MTLVLDSLLMLLLKRRVRRGTQGVHLSTVRPLTATMNKVIWIKDKAEEVVPATVWEDPERTKRYHKFLADLKYDFQLPEPVPEDKQGRPFFRQGILCIDSCH